MDPRKKDRYYERAKKEGYLARSVFKLEEIDQKYKILRQGHRILDLGASPGSWMQYAIGKVGPQGLVVGIDKSPIQVSPGPGVECLQADILAFDFEGWVTERGAFHAVLSDVAPKTTGQRDRDHAASLELCEMARSVAMRALKKGGAFVCKMYQGDHTKAFLEGLKPHFEMVKIQKPDASRSESKEIFYVALGFLDS